MPTGYTDPVRKGEVTDLRTFIEMCAHAVIPALYQQSMTTPIPTSVASETDKYDRVMNLRKELDQYKLQLQDYRLWSYADAAADQDRAFHESMKHWKDSEAKRIADLARYESMLAQVKAWTVTAPIQGLKDFMIEQLESSIKFDCTPSEWGKPVFRTPDEHRAYKIDGVKKSIEHATRNLNDELERRERNQAWLDEFWRVVPKV